jgi:hypothetical protein
MWNACPITTFLALAACASARLGDRDDNHGRMTIEVLRKAESTTNHAIEEEKEEKKVGGALDAIFKEAEDLVLDTEMENPTQADRNGGSSTSGSRCSKLGAALFANDTSKEEENELLELADEIGSVMNETNKKVKDIAEEHGMSAEVLVVLVVEANTTANHTQELEDEVKDVDQAINSIMKEADLMEKTVEMELMKQSKEESKQESNAPSTDAALTEAERAANHKREEKDEEEVVAAALDSIVKEAESLEKAIDTEAGNHP